MTKNRPQIESISYRLKQFRRRITYSEGFISFLAAVAVFFIRVYSKTLRIRYEYHPEFERLDRKKVLFGFWHGRQFLLIPSYGDWHVSLLSDLSWAGDIQTKILERMGYKVIRGSSKRKGVQALISLKKVIESGYSTALALDGPRGPIYHSKPGILFLAQKLGYPIIPTATTAKHAWIFKNTWCRYMLPKPFSRCYIMMDEPFYVNSGFNEVQQKQLDTIMRGWTRKADEIIGREVDPELTDED